MPAAPYIVIADAHVDESSAEAFFNLLGRIEASGVRVIFLGDVFELWIAIPRYEQTMHRRFLDWSRRQREKPILIEGNHEFFVNQRYGGLLETDGRTWDPPGWLEIGAVLAGHGDRINRHDWKYRSFRRVVRNPLAYALLKLLPFGPAIVERIRQRMKGTNLEYRKHLPVEFLERLPESLRAPADRKILIGHFHQESRFRGGQVLLLPSWRDGGRIAKLDATTGNLQILLDSEL